MHEKILAAFARWFASGAGVWQTFIVTLAVCVVEFIFPNWDPNHFAVLFWLTVYSGVTQPALAYVSSQADSRTEAVLSHLEQMVGSRTRMDDEQLSIIKLIAGTK